MVDLDTAREEGRNSVLVFDDSESWRRKLREVLIATWCDWEPAVPAGRNGRGFFLAWDRLDSAPERSRSTGVFGREVAPDLPSVRDEGLSYRNPIGLAGD